MGELIRTIGNIKFKDRLYEVEENESSGEEKLIHMQSDEFRLEVLESEFVQLASLIIVAGNEFDNIKKHG